MLRLHRACFPEEEDSDDRECGFDARFARLAFLHDLADCTWVLLWRTDHRCGRRCRHCAPVTLPASESCTCIRKLKLAAVRSVRALVGLVTAVDYGDCLYCFNFAVAPKLRGRGLGRRLQHECQRIALGRGFRRVAGTVDTSSPRLVGYYLALGGRLVPTGAPCRARSGNTLVVIGSVSSNLLAAGHRVNRQCWRRHQQRRPGAAERARGAGV